MATENKSIITADKEADYISNVTPISSTLASLGQSVKDYSNNYAQQGPKDIIYSNVPGLGPSVSLSRMNSPYSVHTQHTTPY